MKKVIIYIVAAIVFASCGKITVTGANGTEYESVEECCAANDYEAAHRFLAKMKNELSRFDSEAKKKYDDARQHVFKQEALYLMSIGDEQSRKRIIYLLQELGSDNEICSTLINLSIGNDDDELVKKLANMYTSDAESGLPDEDIRKIMIYLCNKDAENNLDYINDFLTKLGKTGYEYRHLKKDLAIILAKQSGKFVSDEIVGLLTEQEAMINTKPPMGTTKHEYDFSCCYPWGTYHNDVAEFNEFCISVLGEAIKTKNQYLATRVVDKVKTNIDYSKTEKEGKSHIIHIMTTKNDYSDIEKAKTIYNEAVRNGAFK